MSFDHQTHLETAKALPETALDYLQAVYYAFTRGREPRYLCIFVSQDLWNLYKSELRGSMRFLDSPETIPAVQKLAFKTARLIMSPRLVGCHIRLVEDEDLYYL